MSDLPEDPSLTMVELTSNNLSSQQEGFVTISVDNLETSIRLMPESVIPAPVKEITEDESPSPTESETTFLDEFLAAHEENVEFVRAKNEKRLIKQSYALMRMKNYIPQPFIFSVGPHHRRLTSVQDGEHQKWGLQDLVFTDKSILRDVIKCIKDMEPMARACYEKSFIELSNEEFVRILLLDSIFLMICISYDADDKHKSVNVFEGSLLADVLLPDNQIPFFVIRKLWDKVHPVICINDRCRDASKDEIGLGCHLECTTFVRQGVCNVTQAAENAEHLLDLYYQCNVPTHTQPEATTLRSTQRGDNISATSAFLSASELYEYGIKFKAKKNPDHVFDISFQNGVLHIPPLVIDSINTSIIASLLSWEDISETKNGVVTGYVRLMDSLINTKEDVQLLQKFNIVNNKMPSDDDAAAFINSIGDSIAFSYDLSKGSNVYAPLMEEMRNYIAPSWRRNLTSLKHTYFSNPWTGISVIAGSSLLILTIMQTYYTAYAYYHPNN